jgi:hypothetical protein
MERVKRRRKEKKQRRKETEKKASRKSGGFRHKRLPERLEENEFVTRNFYWKFFFFF